MQMIERSAYYKKNKIKFLNSLRFIYVTIIMVVQQYGHIFLFLT